MRFRFYLLWLLLLTGAPSWSEPVIGLHQIHQTSSLRSSQLIANSGWQPIYSLELAVQKGDLLAIDSQIQLTVDSTEQVGQQFRLLVDGQPVGTRTVAINVKPSSHHLPVKAFALYKVERAGVVQVAAEASAFHSEGNFVVTVDQADNLSYGNLLVEHFRAYPSEDERLAQQGLLLQDHLVGHIPGQQTYGLRPYIQEAISQVLVETHPRELLRLTGQALGQAIGGLEMVAGVLAADERAVSPYGGENVGGDNLFAPLNLEGLYRPEPGKHSLEFRVYGGFGRGFRIYPGTGQLQVLRFGPQSGGKKLWRWGQAQERTTNVFPSNTGTIGLIERQLFLGGGDTLWLKGNVQFAKPELPEPVTVECQMRLAVEGGPEKRFQKNLTPTQVALPLSGGLIWTAPKTGSYRVSLQVSGHNDRGAVRLRLDADQSQLQFRIFRAD